MNGLFGMDVETFKIPDTNKNKAYCLRKYSNLNLELDYKGSYKTHSLSPERVLLFAEIPFLTISGVQNPSLEVATGSGASPTDCTLQYEATKNSYSKPESIGFNHKVGNNYVAHVAFADGHVTQIRLPGNASESTLLTLTRWLCTGSEIEFDGANYTEAANSN